MTESQPEPKPGPKPEPEPALAAVGYDQSEGTVSLDPKAASRDDKYVDDQNNWRSNARIRASNGCKGQDR